MSVKFLHLGNRYFFRGGGDVFKFFFPTENILTVHMKYHLFLHCGWFPQNLGLDFIRTNMHTTVYELIIKNVQSLAGILKII